MRAALAERDDNTEIRSQSSSLSQILRIPTMQIARTQSQRVAASRRSAVVRQRVVSVRAVVEPSEKFSTKDGAWRLILSMIQTTHPPPTVHACTPPPHAGRNVEVYAGPIEVGKAICQKFKAAYEAEVKAKGSLVIAIPSGSVVTAIGSLKGSKDIDFSKVRYME